MQRPCAARAAIVSRLGSGKALRRKWAHAF
jgi:hypothetical protein